MFGGKRIRTPSDIRSVIEYYDREATAIEQMSSELRIDEADLFKVIFNFRFTFKKPSEFTDVELLELLTDVESNRDKYHSYERK